MGKKAEAVDCYEKALSIYPDHTGALHNKNMILNEMGYSDQ